MKNKVVVVTGASSGIGKALAERFAAGGSRLALGARSEDKLAALAERLPAETAWRATNVTRPEDCEALIDLAKERFGGVDVLINNAGISMRAPFAELDVAVLEELMQVNFWGMVYCTRAAIGAIIERKGSVVGVSSIAGYRGLPERTGYSASKFAMNGFLESLRTELLDDGVHVLTACPGFTQSNIRKTARTASGAAQGESPRNEAAMMTAEAVADEIYRAVVRRKRDLVLTRQGKMTVFLNKLFPAFMDRQVFKHFKKEGPH